MDGQAFGDVICTNAYNGWYAISGRLDDAAKAVEQDAQELRKRHPGKPIMFTEFGADAIAGNHAQPPVMWSEEYQADMVEMYIRTLEKLPFIIGTHPWAFADFRTEHSSGRRHELQRCVHARPAAQAAGASTARAVEGDKVVTAV